MALIDLARDPRMLRTRLVVIDFESLTPAGQPPVPVEVAALTLRCQPDGTLAELDRFASLMRPPADVPITHRDQQAGITPALLAAAPAASEVMTELDHRLTANLTPDSTGGLPMRLLAHHAPTERTLLHGQRVYCPHLAVTSLLDSVSLARRAVPELTNHGLSQVADYLGLRIPHDRHRALADVELTATLLPMLLDRGPWRTLLEIERDATLSPKPATTPPVEQDRLF